MMGLRPGQQKNLRLHFILLKSLLGKPQIRLNDLKTSLRTPCPGVNPIIDSINLSWIYFIFNFLVQMDF